MSLPTIVAWSWGENRYHQHADRLISQCRERGYPFAIRRQADLSDHIAKMPPGPDWEQRMWVYRYIPGFVREMVGKHGDVLYLHCDMSIRAPIPEGAFDGLDIGLESGWSQYPPRPDDRVLAAPIYVRDTEPACRFLDYWHTRCMTVNDNRSEHEHLIAAWRLFGERDRTLRVGTFDPPLGSIRADSDVPIVGHK